MQRHIKSQCTPYTPAFIIYILLLIYIFSDILEDTIEVFMDDFSVIGDSFDRCLSHLAKVLKRCEDCNLMLNWENVTLW